MELPAQFEANLKHALGDAGRLWVAGLPALLESCGRNYGLRIGRPFESMYNYVAPVTRADGSEAVLKLSPHGDDFRYELRATRAFGGRGMARILDSDEDRGIAILEHLRPGGRLADSDDDDAHKTEIGADVMLALRCDPPAGVTLPTVRDWIGPFFDRHRAEYDGAGPLPSALFERGVQTFEDLLRSSPAPTLLHGDLHHHNILSAQRSPWLAIDPHGVIGEPAFEVGAFFGNPSGFANQRDLPLILARRADILSERLGVDRERVLGWAFAYRMLSAVWSAERGDTGWRASVATAAVLADLRR